jgi:hypothetical protein
MALKYENYPNTENYDVKLYVSIYNNNLNKIYKKTGRLSGDSYFKFTNSNSSQSITTSVVWYILTWNNSANINLFEIYIPELSNRETTYTPETRC